MFKVSQSKIKIWRRCRKAYDYRYHQNLERRRKQRPLVFGSICHEMIEAKANGDDPKSIAKKYEKEAKNLFSAERPEYLEIVNDASTIMSYYFQHYQSDKLKFVSVKKKLAEHEFEVELVPGIALKGKIDGIMRDKEDRVWLTEHKSHKQIPTEDVRFRDLQTIIYKSVLPSLGIKKVDGVLWDYIRSKPPGIPELLKNGELSQRAIDTLPEVYLAEVKRHGLNPKDYKEKLKELEGAERNFFRRIYMPFNETVYNTLMSETVETAREMAENRGRDKTRNITKDCSWCAYEPLCRAELLDLDSDFIRKKEYVVNQREEKPDEEAD